MQKEHEKDVKETMTEKNEGRTDYFFMFDIRYSIYDIYYLFIIENIK